MSKELERLTEHVSDMPGSGRCQHDETGHCLTCADEALPATVLRIASSGLAVARVNDAIVEIDINLVDNVRPGDVLLVHAGVAIAHIGRDKQQMNEGIDE